MTKPLVKKKELICDFFNFLSLHQKTYFKKYVIILDIYNLLCVGKKDIICKCNTETIATQGKIEPFF